MIDKYVSTVDSQLARVFNACLKLSTRYKRLLTSKHTLQTRANKEEQQKQRFGLQLANGKT
jgi:hypothetical protein